MIDAFEHFFAGQDKLSALLKALPGFRPTAAQDAAFAAAAHTAQSENTPWQKPPHFEPPERLLADFKTRAARLEVAALAQRKAVLKQIEAGTHPDAILRNRMHPATTHWLRAQAAQVRRQRARQMRLLRRSIFDGINWNILGRAALAGVLAALVTRWLMTQAPSPTEVALLEAFRSESTILYPPQPDVAQNRGSERSAHRPSRLATPQASVPSSQEADPEPDMRASESRSTSPSNMASTHLAVQPWANIETVPENTPHSDRNQVAGKATMAEADASIVPAIGDQDLPLRRAPLQALSTPIPPPATSLMPNGMAVRLEESPALVAQRLPERPAGMVWLIRTPAPTPDRLQTWLEALIRAMPEAGRPARFSVLSDQRPGGDMRIFAPPQP